MWWKAEYYFDQQKQWPDMLALFPEWYEQWVEQYPIIPFQATVNGAVENLYRFGFDEDFPFEYGAGDNRRLDGLNKATTRLSEDFFVWNREDLAEGAREELFFKFYR